MAKLRLAIVLICGLTFFRSVCTFAAPSTVADAVAGVIKDRLSNTEIILICNLKSLSGECSDFSFVKLNGKDAPSELGNPKGCTHADLISAAANVRRLNLSSTSRVIGSNGSIYENQKGRRAQKLLSRSDEKDDEVKKTKSDELKYDYHQKSMALRDQAAELFDEDEVTGRKLAEKIDAKVSAHMGHLVSGSKGDTKTISHKDFNDLVLALNETALKYLCKKREYTSGRELPKRLDNPRSADPAVKEISQPVKETTSPSAPIQPANAVK